jgi:hypothetical protein
MHKTRKRGGTRKSIKLRRSQKKLKTINEKITRLRIQARNIENRITSNTSNRALKKELKRKQGFILREIESLKNELKTQQSWNNMLSINDRESCEQINKGIYRNNECYIKAPSGTSCSNKIYREGDRERKQPYCLVDELLSSMEDSASMLFQSFVMEAKENQSKLVESTKSNIRGATNKKVLPRIPVLIRLQTSATGYRHKFIYSSDMGEIKVQPKKTVKEAKRWGKVGTLNDPYGSNVTLQGQYQPMRRPSSQKEKGYPMIEYTPQPGGPYAKFKPLDGSRWPDMPTWSKINEELTYLLQQLFSKNKMISIPSATGSKSKGKKFLISGYTWLPLKFDNQLEPFKSIEKYFTGIPYKFIIIPAGGKLGVILDVKLAGKMMSQEEAKVEMKKIQEAETKEREKLAAMTPEQREAYENSISKRASRANAYLTASCDSHLEAIKDILRSFGSGEGEMTSYDDTKNASLREKFMTNSGMKLTDNIIMTINELLASYNTMANARVNDKPIDIYDYRINPTTKVLSKTFSSNKTPSISDVKRPLKILNGFLLQLVNKDTMTDPNSMFRSYQIPLFRLLTDIVDKEHAKVYEAKRNKQPVSYFIFNLDKPGLSEPAKFEYIGHKIPTSTDVRELLQVKKKLTNLQNSVERQNKQLSQIVRREQSMRSQSPPPYTPRQTFQSPSTYTPQQYTQPPPPSYRQIQPLQSRTISKPFKAQPIISDKPAVDKRAQIRREIAEQKKKEEEARKRRTMRANQLLKEIKNKKKGGRKTRKKRR